MKKTFETAATDNQILKITISTDGSSTGPYFSITADLLIPRDSHNNSPRRCVSSGCSHDEILAVRPDLKPFVDLHCSYLDGTPLHAVENGFYWLCKAAGIPQQYAPEQNKESCFQYLCEHLRIDTTEAFLICGQVLKAYETGKSKIATSPEVTEKCRAMQHEQGVFDAKNHFKKVVDSMKERWQNEAAQAITLLESL